METPAYVSVKRYSYGSFPSSALAAKVISVPNTTLAELLFVTDIESGFGVTVNVYIIEVVFPALSLTATVYLCTPALAALNEYAALLLYA